MLKTFEHSEVKSWGYGGLVTFHTPILLHRISSI